MDPRVLLACSLPPVLLCVAIWRWVKDADRINNVSDQPRGFEVKPITGTTARPETKKVGTGIAHMNWSEIATSSLSSAKAIWKEHPRSSVSRSYYAAHVVLAGRLVDNGYVPPSGRQTQPHGGRASFIKKYLVQLSPVAVKRLAMLVGRLYNRRIDADYKRTVTVDSQVALDSLRDAATVLRTLGVNA